MNEISQNNPTKVLVAMSGGVDSSVVAALLVEQGHQVTGAYMKNFSNEAWQGVLETDCPWEKDVEDCQAVCEKLGIKFRSFNFEKEYKEKVIEYFFAEYAAGRTPNPDIMCNKEIKFKLFLDQAKELGFDYIATGHYARIVEIRDAEDELEHCELFKGVDVGKDQSYFLYELNQDQLSHSLFPIGGYFKKHVRELARKFGLPNAEKKDSQGICFIGHVNLEKFLEQRIPHQEGEIVDTKGNVLGRHNGVWYFTIGQRKGIKIGGAGDPYYVVAKDVDTNRLTVAHGRDDKSMYGSALAVKSFHWTDKPKSMPLNCAAKIRYGQPDQLCYIKKKANGFVVEFVEPQFAITPGQAIVLYDGDELIGGGIIEEQLPTRIKQAAQKVQTVKTVNL